MRTYYLTYTPFYSTLISIAGLTKLVKQKMKRTKNIPVFYDEIKKGHEIFFTDTTWNELKARAKDKKLSVSEYIERWVRGTQD